MHAEGARVMETRAVNYGVDLRVECPHCLVSGCLSVHSTATVEIKDINAVCKITSKKFKCRSCGRIHTDRRAAQIHSISNKYSDAFIDAAVDRVAGRTIAQAVEVVEEELGHKVSSTTLHDWAIMIGVDTSWARHRNRKGGE